MVLQTNESTPVDILPAVVEDLLTNDLHRVSEDLTARNRAKIGKEFAEEDQIPTITLTSQDMDDILAKKGSLISSYPAYLHLPYGLKVNMYTGGEAIGSYNDVLTVLHFQPNDIQNPEEREEKGFSREQIKMWFFQDLINLKNLINSEIIPKPAAIFFGVGINKSMKRFALRNGCEVFPYFNEKSQNWIEAVRLPVETLLGIEDLQTKELPLPEGKDSQTVAEYVRNVQKLLDEMKKTQVN
jgi:hypothetical protein